MGWKFSKSVKMGPLKVNFSKSGVGWSVGGKGFRTGVDAKGKKYNHVSIPGTGISNRTYEEASQKNPQNREVNWFVIIGLFFLISLLKAFL